MSTDLPPPLAELLGITSPANPNGGPPQSPQTPLYSKFHSWMTAGLLGQDAGQDANINRLRHQCRTGNPFPLIARLWPSILVPPDHPHAAVLRANLQQVADADVPDSIKSICLDESNPILRIDWWQAIILAAVFDLSIGEIALAGATGIGKGFASSVSVCLWYEVFRESRIHLTGPNSEKCRTGILGEIVQWRGQQSICCEGTVRAESIHHNKRHYIEVLNPSIDSKNADEKFSGAHGKNTIYLFDEATALPSSWVENARRNSQMVMALGNPRTLSGWFRGLFDQMDPAKRVQVIPGLKGQRLCMQIGGEQCLNVRYRRLRVPVAPQGGIEIDPAVHF